MPGFKFHPLCKNLQLMSLCFGNDLMIFFRGDMRSINLMMDGFEHFSRMTGSVANKGKSQIYINGVSQAINVEITTRTGFSQGSFPIKYLGMPLSPTKWLVSTCQYVGGRKD